MELILKKSTYGYAAVMEMEDDVIGELSELLGLGEDKAVIELEEELAELLAMLDVDGELEGTKEKSMVFASQEGDDVSTYDSREFGVNLVVGERKDVTGRITVKGCKGS